MRQISGIADVSNVGGITTQFQIEVDPDKLQEYDLSLSQVIETIEDNNANAGGSMIVRGDLSYVVRGIGLIKDLNDLGHIVIKTVNGTPVFLSDVENSSMETWSAKAFLAIRKAITIVQTG